MGNFLWKSRPVRAPHCAFFDAPHAMRRHFSAGAAPAPRSGYKIRPPVFYTARRLIRTLPCAASAIVRQSADGPPSPARPRPAVAPPKPDSVGVAPACGGYTFYSDTQVAVKRPRRSARLAVCPALRGHISGNASATRTPGSRAGCRYGSPCPANLVQFIMRAAPDGGTGVPEVMHKTGLRRARRIAEARAVLSIEGNARHRGDGFDQRLPLHAPRKASILHTKSAAPSRAAPPNARKPAIAQAVRIHPKPPSPQARHFHCRPSRKPAPSASPHKKRRPLPGSACFAICTFRHGSLSSAPSPAPAWAWRSAPAPPARLASGGRRRRCLSWPRCRCTA